MKYPCIESTIDIPIAHRLIRLWINQDIIKDDYVNDSALADVIKKFSRGKSNEEIIQFVSGCNCGVNAIQIKETKTNRPEHGVVVYLVDFSPDIHG